MKYITPTDITDSEFVSSDIAEDDYDEWVLGDPYTVGDRVMVSTSGEHKNYYCISDVSAGLAIDILDELCDDWATNGWTDNSFGGGVSSISPAGQFRLDSGGTVYGSANRSITPTTPPDTFTLQIKTYCDSTLYCPWTDYFMLFYSNATWLLRVRWCSTGLFIATSGADVEVGTDLVKSGSAAEWQEWRFQVDKTVEGSATVEVFLKNSGDTDFTSQGTVDCDALASGSDLLSISTVYGTVSGEAQIVHIDYIKIATGLGKIATTDDAPNTNTTNWLEVSPTNRWKPFDGELGTQAEQATSLTYVLAPGVIDSVALLALESSSVEIVEIDEDDDLVTNGQAWTDATGTTQPTGWDKVGTPTDFTIDSTALQITVDDTSEGISQTITVAESTEYQLVGIYKNTAGDLAQYAVYDVSNSGDILATTDLASATDFSTLSYVFTTPSGCTSVKISLLAKTSGDIVWFDSIVLAPTGYSETVTTGLSRTDIVKTDLPGYTNALLTVTVNYAGGTAKVGEIIPGVKTSLGTTKPQPQVGIKDYSTKTEDVYGHYTIVERSFAKRLTCTAKILNTGIDEAFRLLAACRATAKVWIADEDYSCLIVYGFYKEFNILLAYPDFSICSIEVEGLT